MSTGFLPAMGTDREADKIKIKQILTATIVSLCNNGLSFESELCVEGLLGITLDKKDVLLVNIKETVSSSLKKKAKPSEGPAQGSRPQQTTANKQQQMQQQQQQQQIQQQQLQQQQIHQQQMQQQQMQQQQQMPRKQQPQPQQQTPRKQQQQEQPPTPGKSSQESFGRVKAEPMLPKVVSESQTQCMAVQPYGGGYAQVQKSVKMVQNAQGVVEQKQMEWRTYAADGRVLEHKKVQEVQTVAPSVVPVQGGFVSQPMAATNVSSGMPGYQGPNIKVEPGCEDDLYGQEEEGEYYDGEEQDYEDYDCMREGYPDMQEQYPAGAYPDQNQQFGPAMDNMGPAYHEAQGSGRGRRGGTARKPPVKRQKKEKMPPSKSTPNKKSMKLHTPMTDPSVLKNTQTKGSTKEVNNSLVQRALDMVNEGKLSAAAAINLFGIPKSTFYKKLATSIAEKEQFAEAGDMEGMEEAWDDGVQGNFDMVDPAYSDYTA